MSQTVDKYQASILRNDIKLNVAIELASPQGWAQYVGREGLMIGISTFGASAPGDRIAKEYGFPPDSIINKIKDRL